MSVFCGLLLGDSLGFGLNVCGLGTGFDVGILVVSFQFGTAGLYISSWHFQVNIFVGILQFLFSVAFWS